MFKKEFSNLNKLYTSHLYTGFLGKLFTKSHELMEKNTKFLKNNKKKILEVGAGLHPHVNYLKHSYYEYHIIDADENNELKKFYKEKFRLNKKVKFKRYNKKKIPFSDNYFDRCIISHCLEHIYYPQLFLDELYRVTKKGGMISIALPTDPGILWRAGRLFNKYIIQIKSYNLKPLDYDYVNAIEHVNSIFNLQAIIKKKYKFIIERYFPFNLLKFSDFNLFYIVDIFKK